MLARMSVEISSPGSDDNHAIENVQMRSQATIDHEIIRDLQAEGLIAQEAIANLQIALKSARVIGAAIGIIMASMKLTEEDAFAALRSASQHTNVKLRDVAADVVLTGAIDA